jgi:hypothetical protein
LLGRDSGPGSYGEFARHKAEFLNAFVAEHDVATVLEFGCGDGGQLALAQYPSYIGLDVAPSAIDLCKQTFGEDATKSFFLTATRQFVDHHGVFRAELTLSLDVLYHLVEDDLFDLYLRQLFAAATRFVIIYSSDSEIADRARHVRHRRFTPWVQQNQAEWQLLQTVPNPVPGAVARFYVYGRVGNSVG